MRAAVPVLLLVLASTVGAVVPTPGAGTGAAPLPAATEGTFIWSGGAADGVVRWLAGAGLPHHAYPNLGMAAFVGSPADAARLVAAHGGRVDPDEEHRLHLDRSVPYIEADRVRDRIGLVRDGPTVLVVDTGIDTSHPDFAAGENLAANVQADRTGGLVTGVLDNQPVVDVAGHGTHVAGIVAGTGRSLGDGDPLNGRYLGVYSNGRVAGFQASTDAADPDDIRVDTVAALEAFDWAIANRERFDIRVVTNSWGTPGDMDAEHPINRATLELYLRGMTVVFSAGNEGEKGAGTLNKYCLAPWVLCVAAGDLDGARSSFSSYGRPPDEGRPWDHPDLTAPGYFIHSAEPPTRTSPGGIVGNTLQGRASESLYRDRSGSSMAAPHVAATAALLQAANPRLSPDQVMDVLVATTDPMADDVAKAGTGYLNAREAYNLAIRTSGNRNAFLAGQAVKYAGEASGDGGFANDPVSQGYNSALVPGPTIPPPPPASWVLSPLGGGIVGALVLAAVLNVLLSLRFRRHTARPQGAVPGAREGQDVADDG